MGNQPTKNQPIYLETEKQMALSDMLFQVLLSTRGEPGIPLEEIARIIKTVFDRSEVECIIRTLKTNDRKTQA
jgi:hypothetical protein